MALSSAGAELVGIERKMLEALGIAWDHWKSVGGPVPPSLVKLMSETHAAVRERIKRQFGINAENVSTREMLVEVRQLEQQLLELIATEEEANEDQEGQVSPRN